MGKTITLSRRELVWQTRQNTWDETDYARLLAWLKSIKENHEHDEKDTWTMNNWVLSHIVEYDVLSQYTWDQIVDFMQNGTPEDEPRIQYFYADGTAGYTESIGDVIMDYMREDNYDADVSDEDYADDYYEDLYYGE